MAIVETQNLTKIFDGRKAVDRMNLVIEEGEIFGLLGPNGAGKTTTIAMLSTILQPTDGTAVVSGYDIRRQPKDVRRAIGVVPQDVALYEDLTAAENLAYFGKLYDISGDHLEERIDKLLELVKLKDRRNERVKKFSGGMKDRLNLAIGLIHKPRLLFLDEPTTGLDPQARLAVWDLVKKLRADGITILLTTHYMEEADYLCNRVAIIDNGEIIARDSPEVLKRSIGEFEVIELKVTGISEATMTKLRKLSSVKEVVQTSEGLRLLTSTADAILGQVVKSVASGKSRVDSLNVVKPTLEDVFIKLTGKTLRD